MGSLYKPLETWSKRFRHQIPEIYLIWSKKAKYGVSPISQGVCHLSLKFLRFQEQLTKARHILQMPTVLINCLYLVLKIL